MPACPHCGQETRSSDRFCKHCGRLMDVAPDSSVGPLALRASGRELNGRAQPQSQPQRNGQVNQTARAPISGTITPGGPLGGTPHPDTVVARLVLQVRAGSGQAPQEVPMDGRDITIGRAPGCDVVLPDDPLASRRHTLLRYDGQRYTIADLGSSNGTYVNDVEIHEVTPLKLGDRLTVGEHEYLYLAPDLTSTGAGSQDRFNTDGFQIRTPPSFSAAAPLLSVQPAPAAPRPPVETVKAPAVSDPQVAAPAAPVAPAASPATAPATPVVSDAAPSAGAPSVADPVARDIEDLRARLLEVSSALARRSEGAEQVVRHLRDIMGELRAQVDEALALPGARGGEGDAEPAQAEELLSVVRAAAENPRHLDHVTALAGRANDLAATLQAQQQRIGALEAARAGMAAALEQLRVRLSKLIEDERQHGGEPPAS